ncbi:hypothetical protein NLJ89_g11836 [Agrocybe chaxingu]|uniref:Uncharacterized protein n=1 Tax=Agrocybe chaxingu TaxID=84603 RepID=A0A9W8JNF8_9AGAR|nr:hypothetical protein NLJ89_g11836 [Agrocybe chaxingu]
MRGTESGDAQSQGSALGTASDYDHNGSSCCNNDDDDGEGHSYSDSSGPDDDSRSTNGYLGILCQCIKTRCDHQRIHHFCLDNLNLYYFYYIYPSSCYYNFFDYFAA